jgi:hypothetical protein
MLKTIAALIIYSLLSYAQGAVEFSDLNALSKSDFYRLTCSDVTLEPHAHSHIVVEQGRTTVLKIAFVYPGLSMQDTEFSKSDLKGIEVKVSTHRFSLAGKRAGSYWSEQVQIDLFDREDAKGFRGRLFYDDGDGLTLDRAVQCRALNHLISTRR